MPPFNPESSLRLGVFFDGTGNHLANAHDVDASHIAELFGLYPHAPERRQLRLYIEGIGTQAGAPDSLFAMATGKGRLGWQAAIGRAHHGVLALVGNWLRDHPGEALDSIEIDLFGFSRGAACARHFANDLCAGHASNLGQALQQAGAGLHSVSLRIGFMGLFDTVASILGPGPAPCLQLAEGMARRIVHLVAADEHRHNFALTSAGAYDLPVPGAHSDIGGGYRPVMEEQLILSRPDGCTIAPQRSGEDAPSVLRTTALLEGLASGVPDYGFECQVRTWQQPRYSRGRVEEIRMYAALEGRRSVHNDLSLVYLELMHRLAVAQGVPLQPLPAHEYPAELHSIVGKLLAHADAGPAPALSASEQALLYRRYIHRSHHWTTDGPGQTSDLDALFVHRPAAGGKRQILST